MIYCDSFSIELYLASVPGEFLINTENCKIPNVNPYSKEAMKYFKAWAPVKCNSSISPLTLIKRDGDGVKLVIDKQIEKDYLGWWQDNYSVSRRCFISYRLLI
jgi:hypothetical protein